MSKINILGIDNTSLLLDGTPNNGGTVEIFEADGTFNTSNYKSAYQESALSTAQNSPITLGADGRPENGSIWVDGNCDVRIKNSSGTVIRTEESVNPTTTDVSEANYNLVLNGSFESPVGDGGFPDDWTSVVAPGTGEIDNSDSQHGKQCMLFTSTGSGGRQIISSAFMEVNEGAIYELTFWLNCTVADIRNLVEVIWYDKDESQLSTTTAYDESSANPTSWTQKRYLLNPPSTARYAKLRIYGCHSSDGTSGSARVDDVQITEVSSYPVLIKGADLASASTLTLGADGNFFDVTGTTTITAISGDQHIVHLQFDGELSITENTTSLILNGQSISTHAGLILTFFQYSSGNWQLISSNHVPVATGLSYKKLVVVNNATNPTYQMDVDATQLLVHGDGLGGRSLLLSTVNLTVDLTASGANGLDTSTEATSTGYYIHVIYNPASGTTAGLFSTSYDAPTMPSGYTYRVCVGWCYNTSGGDIRSQTQRGRDVSFVNGVLVVASGTATSLTSVDCSALVPAEAETIRVKMQKTGSVSGVSYGYISGNSTTTLDTTSVAMTQFSIDINRHPFVVGEVTPTVAQTIYYAISGGGTANVHIHGYKFGG